MGRDILRVDLVSIPERDQLRAEAKRLYGKANASLLVRQLLVDHFHKTRAENPFVIDQTEATGRVELRLPVSVIAELERRAEARFSKRNYYINSLLLDHLGHPQMQGDEIETLRNSNYELAKIGTNLNQIAKAFNILVSAGGGDRLPEIGKKMASLRKEITTHINKVLKVLEVRTTQWENPRGGKRIDRTRKTNEKG